MSHLRLRSGSPVSLVKSKIKGKKLMLFARYRQTGGGVSDFLRSDTFPSEGPGESEEPGLPIFQVFYPEEFQSIFRLPCYMQQSNSPHPNT